MRGTLFWPVRVWSVGVPMPVVVLLYVFHFI
jgi:hypothetical protein